MSAKPCELNRFLGVFLCQFLSIPGAFSQVFELTESDEQWLGEKIFANECSHDFACLSSWNEGEEFPSLGIGHFIWFPPGSDLPFEETFPELLRFYKSQLIKLPDWLDSATELGAPWHSREDFYANFNSKQTMELRLLLANTKSEQVNFIVQKINQSLGQIIASFPSQQQSLIEGKISTIAQSHPPYGSYAVIDYLHFKGTGLSPSEHYENYGWGLKQVISGMENSPTTIYSFVQSAKGVLTRRVENSPESRNEKRWLQGWHKRLETYLPPL